MKNDRLRIPVHDEYLVALGRAGFAFSLLEWNAVCCCERVKPGSLTWARGQTAGTIADRLFNQARNSPPSPHKAEWLSAAHEFKRLVLCRNNLVHSGPCSGPDGDSRLARDDFQWTIPVMNEVADEFAACSIRLNALLHGPLAPKTQG